LSSASVVTPGLTSGTSRSSTSAARRPARRMPFKIGRFVQRDREMGLAGGFKNLGLGYDGHDRPNIMAGSVKPNLF
jgi:hypothetical protein